MGDPPCVACHSAPVSRPSVVAPVGSCRAAELVRPAWFHAPPFRAWRIIAPMLTVVAPTRTSLSFRSRLADGESVPPASDSELMLLHDDAEPLGRIESVPASTASPAPLFIRSRCAVSVPLPDLVR